MLNFRPNELVDFEHYLQVRQQTVVAKSRKPMYRRGLILSACGTALSVLFHAGVETSVLGTAASAFFGLYWAAAPKSIPVTPDQELRVSADHAAQVFQQLLRGRKLRGSLHSGVAAVLNECAFSWRRIVAVNQSRGWRDSERAEYWKTSQQDWTRAADLAMAEALILGESSVTFKGPRSRAEEVIEEVLGTLRIVGNEHLPPQFRDLREIADNLKTLAQEVESISNTLRAETGTSNQPTASRRLEDVLGQMRAIKTAEEELRQHSGA